MWVGIPHVYTNVDVSQKRQDALYEFFCLAEKWFTVGCSVKRVNNHKDAFEFVDCVQTLVHRVFVEESRLSDLDIGHFVPFCPVRSRCEHCFAMKSYGVDIGTLSYTEIHVEPVLSPPKNLLATTVFLYV
jgi:hypothetical protein